MKIGVTSLGMVGKPIEEAVKWMVEFGAECTELSGKPGVHPGLAWTPEDYPRVKKLLRDAGVVATSLGSYNDFAQTDAAALEAQIVQLIGYCQRAVDLGIPVVRAMCADAKPGHTRDEFRANIIKGFSEAVKRTEKLGVKLAIENHGLMANDGDFQKSIIEAVGSPRLGLTLDTGNYAWAGHSPETVQRYFDTLQPYVFSVHIKDCVWRNGKVEFVPAGEGQLKIEKLLTELVKRGYQGAVVSEFEGEGDYREGTRKSVAYLKSVRDKALGKKAA
jgi:sugar phosphate isomerase/epimerase